MVKRLWNVKLVRFLCVGSFNTILDLIILNILVFLFYMPAVVANLFSATIGTTISYFLNHHLVFRSGEKHTVARFQQFFVITGLSILVVQTLVISGVLYVLHNDGHLVDSLLSVVGLKGFGVGFINLNVAKVLAVLAGMVWNFFLYQKVVFRQHPKAA